MGPKKRPSNPRTSPPLFDDALTIEMRPDVEFVNVSPDGR